MARKYTDINYHVGDEGHGGSDQHGNNGRGIIRSAAFLVDSCANTNSRAARIMAIAGSNSSIRHCSLEKISASLSSFSSSILDEVLAASGDS